MLGAPSLRLLAGEGFAETAQIGVENDGKWAQESESEYFFHIKHPTCQTGRVLLEVGWPAQALSTVLCEGRVVETEQHGDTVRFWLDLGGLTGRSTTLDVHTSLHEPGLLVRIEQNAWHRRAGVYRTTPWPYVEINAALHYMLAAREVVLALGIPQFMVAHQEGRVAIMGFETNNPPHWDAPPHWHLICEWPRWYGASAPHLYLDANGRHKGNRASVNGARAVASYQDGEWCVMRGYTGKDLAAVQYTSDGAVAITAPLQPIYLISYCHEAKACFVQDENRQEIGRLAAVNDPDAGQLSFAWLRSETGAGGAAFPATYQRTVQYDPLTGHVRETLDHDNME